MARLVLTGQPGSPGGGAGRLLFVPQVPRDDDAATSLNGHADPVEQEGRLVAALASAAAGLEELARATSERAGPGGGGSFPAPGLFARDPGIMGPAIELVRRGLSAEHAMDRTSSDAADSLAAVDDEYFRERAADL